MRLVTHHIGLYHETEPHFFAFPLIKLSECDYEYIASHVTLPGIEAGLLQLRYGD
jgi:hypothetical protein